MSKVLEKAVVNFHNDVGDAVTHYAVHTAKQLNGDAKNISFALGVDGAGYNLFEYRFEVVVGVSNNLIIKEEFRSDISEPLSVFVARISRALTTPKGKKT